MKNGFIFSVIAALLLTLPAILQAQEPEPVNLELQEIIAIGLRENIGLQIERANIPLVTESVVVEDARFDSELSSAVELQRSETPYESSTGFSGTSDFEQTSAQAGLSKRFSSGLNATLSLETARASDNDISNDLDPRYQSALLIELTQPLLRNRGSAINTTDLETSRITRRQTVRGYLLEAQNLITRLELAVWQLSGSAEVVSLRRAALVLADDLYAANSKRYRAGLIPVSEVQEAETAQANRMLELSVARQNHDLQLEELRKQLNYRLPGNFNLQVFNMDSALVEPYRPEDPDALFSLARERRLDLKIAADDLQSGTLQKNYAQNQVKPQLDLTLQAGVNGLSGDDRGAVAGTGYPGDWSDSFGSMTENDGYQWTAGLRFSLPLGNRAAKARARQADWQLRQDQLRLHELEATVRNELMQQRIVLERSYEQLRLAERFEELARISLEQEQRRLDEGLSDTFRIISFQEKMLSAQIDRVNALVNYRAAQAQMAFICGRTFTRHDISLTRDTEELDLETL